MTGTVVQQALFGYRDGHDLLASSIELDGESLRLLRSATDVNTEGLRDRYVSTVLPVPKLKCHAFVRSWAASDAPRPGSVYAHVILVDVVTLGRLDSFDGIRALFTPPLNALALDHYRKPLQWGSTERAEPVSQQLAVDIAARLYATDTAVHATHPELEEAEAVLYALLAQQWPKLRREFAFRTRLRPTETTWRVDIEVSGRGDVGPVDEPRWAFRLADDLRHPDTALRKFLARYGSESKRGRVDMPLLVELFEADRAGDLLHAADILAGNFQRRTEMRVLKREVFGQATDARRDLQAIDAILQHPDSFDLAALEVGARLATAAASDPVAARSLVGRLDLPALGDSLASVMVESIARNATAGMLASIASSNPELAVLIVGHRPALLGVPEVWAAADGDLLSDVFFSATNVDKAEVLRGLVHESSVTALATICARQPEIWWDLLSEASRLSSGAQADASAVLRDVLSQIGTSAVAAPTAPLSDADLGVLLQAADLGNGLWRRVEPSRWVDLASQPQSRRWAIPLGDRLSAVALAAGNSSLSADIRSRAWKSTFENLHERLKDAEFDGQAWTLLSGLLPAAPAWDRCLRLRRGVVSEVRRDRWPTAESEALIKQSRGFEGEMQHEIDRINNPSRSWLEQFLGRITGAG